MAIAPTMTIEQEMLDGLPEAPVSLGELAKLEPTNMTITQERSLFGDVVTAQPMRVLRDEARILKKMDVLGARNGSRFFYRYPVRNKRTRQTDYIEGPTVKCTDAAMMSYMNVAVESRTVAIPGDKGGNYICYSRFCDYENGVSLTMGQIVPRSATLGGDDEERRQQIAHNVGQSKSRRNVVNAALGEYVNRAYTAAKRSLIERIGRNIDKAREVITERLQALNVSNIVERVEHVYGRRIKDFLAPDIASVYAELQAISDGMSSIDETWPQPGPPEPKRSDDDTTSSSAEATAPERTVSDASSLPPDAPVVPATGAAPLQQAGSPPTSPPAPTARDWRLEDGILGQDQVVRRLHELLNDTATEGDLDALLKANADRFPKLGRNSAAWNNAVALRRSSFTEGR